MAKICELCGAPAVDAQSLFCNLCGGYIKDEPDAHLPVCRECGIPAPDDQSVFCTRCGLKFLAEPADKYPVCTSCSSVVPDEYAVFCNRCGAEISPGCKTAAPVNLPGAPVPALSDTPAMAEPSPVKNPLGKAPGSVIITTKKHSASHPAKDPAAASQHSNTGTSSYPQGEAVYASLPPGEDKISGDTLPSKKYAHLPLIADELKVKDSLQEGFFSDGTRKPTSSHRKKHAPKNGILGMFRK